MSEVPQGWSTNTTVSTIGTSRLGYGTNLTKYDGGVVCGGEGGHPSQTDGPRLGTTFVDLLNQQVLPDYLRVPLDTCKSDQQVDDLVGKCTVALRVKFSPEQIRGAIDRDLLFRLDPNRQRYRKLSPGQQLKIARDAVVELIGDLPENHNDLVALRKDREAVKQRQQQSALPASAAAPNPYEAAKNGEAAAPRKPMEPPPF